jgi:hypothetical protein
VVGKRGGYVLPTSQALASVTRSYIVHSYVATCDEGLTEWAHVTTVKFCLTEDTRT